MYNLLIATDQSLKTNNRYDPQRLQVASRSPQGQPQYKWQQTATHKPRENEIVWRCDGGHHISRMRRDTEPVWETRPSLLQDGHRPTGSCVSQKPEELSEDSSCGDGHRHGFQYEILGTDTVPNPAWPSNSTQVVSTPTFSASQQETALAGSADKGERRKLSLEMSIAPKGCERWAVD